MARVVIPGGRFVSPRLCGAVAVFSLSLAVAARSAGDLAAPPVQKQVDTALHSVLLVAGVLAVLILAAVAVIVYRKVLSAPPASKPATPDDPLAEAAAEERRGNFTGAACRYDSCGEKLKSGECWEKGKDLARAAECYEAAGDLDRAAQLHVRSGSALRAAGIYMKTGNHIEAAKIFRNKGDHLRAAQALELYGNKLAAAREYTAAGSHAQAARLLEQERMYAEAAAAYQPLLGGEAITAATADRFSTHAALLALAGERERAAATYRRVLEALPGNPRALSSLRKLLPHGPEANAAEEVEPEFLEPAAPALAAVRPPQAAAAPEPVGSPTPPLSPEELDRLIEADPSLEGGDPRRRVFTLRSMIDAGRMDLRYSMRLWVQVMRALADRHGANVVFGGLSPESIVIDMENNVRIDAPAAPGPAYLSPEVQAGLPPDRQADIYSMGVILFELVCGSLDQFGGKRAGELHEDVPPWLDELIERCTEKNLTRRYRTTEEVSAALLRLKTAAQD